MDPYGNDYSNANKNKGILNKTARIVVSVCRILKGKKPGITDPLIITI